MFELKTPRRRSGEDVVRFRDEIDTLFNRFFDIDFPISRRLFGEGEWTPRIDASESESDLTIKAELPGCDAADLDVKLEGRMLTLSGEKKQEKK